MKPNQTKPNQTKPKQNKSYIFDIYVYRGFGIK